MHQTAAGRRSDGEAETVRRADDGPEPEPECAAGGIDAATTFAKHKRRVYFAGCAAGAVSGIAGLAVGSAGSGRRGRGGCQW